MPTGDEKGSYSIRTKDGKTIDLDTAQNKIQLYDYLGYDNQCWIIQNNGNQTVTLLSVYNNEALAISEEGNITLQPYDPLESRQQWTVSY